jgi:hypothetical protein
MAVVVEDGTGLTNSDVYVSVAAADAYFSSRGIDTWEGATGDKEVALRRGRQYLENAYRGMFKGVRTNRTQALSWPRMASVAYNSSVVGVIYDEDGWYINSNEIPQQLRDANCEAALLVLTGSTLEPVLIRGGAIKSENVTAGPVQSETVYQDGAPAVDRYTVIQGLLRGLVDGQPGSGFSQGESVRG